MKRVIKMSKAWIAALVFGIVLTGCGGGSSSDSGSQVSASQQGSETEKTVERSASLSWNAPGQRQNDQSLELYELAGYVISYGQDPENLDKTAYVSSDQYDHYPATLQYTVDNLEEGTWHFSVQAEDSNGLVSPPSELVSKTIQS
jgi:hypothetical protein